jgi:hypothetical protein
MDNRQRMDGAACCFGSSRQSATRTQQADEKQCHWLQHVASCHAGEELMAFTGTLLRYRPSAARIIPARG